MLRVLFAVIGLSSFMVQADGNVSLSFGSQIWQVELAMTPEERAQGLMNRASLCEDCGMLFQFEYPRQVSFWMRDTYIPLDIAYMDAKGKILAIEVLEPLDERGVPSPNGVLYAWEMNRGWFKAQQLGVGDTVTIAH